MRLGSLRFIIVTLALTGALAGCELPPPAAHFP